MKIRPAGVAAWSVWGLAIISIGLAMFSRFFVVRSTMQPAHASLWLRLPETGPGEQAGR